MIEIIKWWYDKFNRNSLDGGGRIVDVVVHDQTMTDNAYWSTGSQRIYICEPGSLFNYSCAVANDALVHESTHAVLQYVVGPSFSSYYRNAPGAINEGYADIFACLNDKNWTIGEDLFTANSIYSCLRNVAFPDDSRAATRCPSELYGTYYIDYTQSRNDNGGVHTNSSLVSHAAYLMYKNGLSWDELGELWYKSMFLGLYSATSDFHTVRRAVMQAARLMNWSEEKKDIIADAFDEEKIYGDKGILSGTVDSRQWNVWLSWGDNVADADEPYDLDAHVIVWKTDGTYVETFYACVNNKYESRNKCY